MRPYGLTGGTLELKGRHGVSLVLGGREVNH